MSKDEYLITDKPLKALTVFAMPMILGSFFQQIYNMADSIIVGRFVGSSTLAAVGACAASVSYTHLVYSQNDSVLRNLFSFTDAMLDIKGYTGPQDFARNFPFVPYQFIIMHADEGVRRTVVRA